LSTVVPGAGQFFLGRRRKAIILLALLIVVSIGFWVLRLPSSFPGLIVLVWSGLLLSLYAVYDALSARSKQSRLSKWWLLLCIPMTYFGFNFIFTSLLLTSGFRALKFSSTAMEPTLLPRDKFIYDADYYRHQSERRNDLVVMRIEGLLTVKRVVAAPGDTIEGRDRQILLNGVIQAEPFVQHCCLVGTNPRLDTFGPVTVPAHKYFVLGDNRDISRDSRLPDFGLVDEQSMAGKPLYIYRILEKGKLWQELH
jgi:signal peptidase I